MNWLYKVLDWILGSADKTLDEFEKHFPGRCPICALDRAARFDGVMLPPTRHECPEGRGHAEMARLSH